jgi:hypothetical protein
MWFIVCASMELSICHEIVAPGNFDIRGGKGFRRAQTTARAIPPAR